MEKRTFNSWTIIEKINFYQRKIILNCIMYYDKDKSYLEDSYYDEISHKLVELQKRVSNSRKYDLKRDTTYGYMMFDFDGNTGFDLISRLNIEDYEYLNSICNYRIYLDEHKKTKKQIKKRGLF